MTAAELKAAVRQRAGFRCEYCQLPQRSFPLRFETEHIVAGQHHGETAPANLALACPDCNRAKGPNLSGIDPVTGRLTRLFNPRLDRWPQHFAWQGAELFGLTAAGRTTIDVLKINRPQRVELRALLKEAGLFHPQETAE